MHNKRIELFLPPDAASRLVACLVFSCFTLLCAASARGQPAPGQHRFTGARVAAVQHVSASMDALLALAAQGVQSPAASGEVAWTPVPLAKNKAGAPLTPSPLRAVSQTAAPEAVDIAVVDSFAAMAQDFRFPPDTNGAVGPSHLMVALNDRVRFQTKFGAELGTLDLLSFWAPLGVNDVFDPRTIYDPFSGRFLFVSCANREAADSSMLFAVSATSDPTGAWDMWRLDGDASDLNWVDFPSLGFTSDRITFTSNLFRSADREFAGVNIWVLEKASVLGGGALDVTLFSEQGIGSVLAPCVTFDAAETTQYLVNRATLSVLGSLRLFTITGAPGSPVLSVTGPQPIAPGWSPLSPGAPQLGTASLLATNDDRVLDAVLRNGRLWCVQTVGLPRLSPTDALVKWWEIDPVAGATIQSGEISGAPEGLYYFYPSIAVNGRNEVVVVFRVLRRTPLRGVTTPSATPRRRLVRWGRCVSSRRGRGRMGPAGGGTIAGPMWTRWMMRRFGRFSSMPGLGAGGALGGRGCARVRAKARAQWGIPRGCRRLRGWAWRCARCCWGFWAGPVLLGGVAAKGAAGPRKNFPGNRSRGKAAMKLRVLGLGIAKRSGE